MTQPERVLVNEVARLISEGHSGVEAWREVLHRPRRPALAAAEINAQARAKAMSELKASDSRSVPNTTVQAIQPGRQDATIPTPERKPGESDLDWRQRVKRHINGLAQPAGKARGQDVTRDTNFAEKKRALLASESANAAETIRVLMSRPGGVFKSSGELEMKAKALLKLRGQSTSPRRANFRENYRKALEDAQ